jgi:protein-tyrosine-phosphatase
MFLEEAHELPVRAASLGILELGPEPALPEAQRIAHTMGLDLTGHRARTISPGVLRGADLIVGFERKHVAAAVVDGHASRAHTFTLPELVGLLERSPSPLVRGGPIDRARARVAEAGARRGRAAAVDPPELLDPMGMTWREQVAIAERLRDLVGELTDLLFE